MDGTDQILGDAADQILEDAVDQSLGDAVGDPSQGKVLILSASRALLYTC